jgi:hypothetical protein
MSEYTHPELDQGRDVCQGQVTPCLHIPHVGQAQGPSGPLAVMGVGDGVELPVCCGVVGVEATTAGGAAVCGGWVTNPVMMVRGRMMTTGQPAAKKGLEPGTEW